MIKRRTYLCICEGQQETMYLAHIARLLTHFPERVVKFNTTIGPPSELKKHYEEYDSAALFDQDGARMRLRREFVFARHWTVWGNAAAAKNTSITHTAT